MIRQVTFGFLISMMSSCVSYAARCAVSDSIPSCCFTSRLQWRIRDLQTGVKVERRRREYRGAKGAEGVGVKILLTSDLKCRLLVHSERYFLQFSYLLYKQEPLLWGLQNLLLQPACNAQHRDSKRRQTQACWKVEATTTLVFPRPIVCSRLSNNINIYTGEKNCQAANGGPCPRHQAGSATARLYCHHVITPICP